MHPFIPLTETDRARMLEAIGLGSTEELFAAIPAELRAPFECKALPAEGASEYEVLRRLETLASRNLHMRSHPSFLGAGTYDHFVPAAVGTVASRSEFATAYTPYQAEVSQGTLQVIYEWQSLVCALTGMEVSNASLYDGATALAEAAYMAQAKTRKKKILVSRGVKPQARRVLATYLWASGGEIEELPLDDSGRTVLPANTDEAAAVVLGHPNFLGVVEDLEAAKAKLTGKALLVVDAYPVALGLLEAPGKLGADIVVGEASAFGNRPSYGGPGLGFMAASKALMRNVPGRMCGKACQINGQGDGFTLTLQAREQHIRRHRASSNICSNQALCALAATMHLVLLGRAGLREMAETNFHKAHYARKRLVELGGVEPLFPEGPFFNEFALKLSETVAEANGRLLEHGIVGGFNLAVEYPEYGEAVLLAVTECRSKDEIDRLVQVMGGA